MSRVGSGGADARGVSETVGFVLVFGIVITATAVLLVHAGAAIDDGKRNVEVSQAEHSLIQFDSRASQVALGDSTVQQVDLGVGGTDGTLNTREDAGWMRVRLVDHANGTTETVANESLGAATYDHGRTTVAYQGGGVWRTDGAGSVMVSRPEMEFRDETLTLPIITVDGSDAVHSDVEITGNGPAERKYPNETAGWENKVENSIVQVSVQSDYYEAWGRYFETSTGGFVSYDHDAEVATVTFPAYSQHGFLRSGVIATSGNGELELAGNGAYTDSYNSSEGDYNSTWTENGSVEAVGNVTLIGDSSVLGDIYSGNTVDLAGSSNVTGDVYYTEDYVQDGASVAGNASEISGVPPVLPLDGYVATSIDQVRTDNDNDNATVIQDDRLTIDESSGTLTAGTYYLEDLSLCGGTLTLDTTDGNVTIGVRDYVYLHRCGQGNDGGHVEVVGDGVVRLFVAGEETRHVEAGDTNLQEDRDLTFFVSYDSHVDVPQERASQLRVFGKHDYTMTMVGANNDNRPTYFEGVVYAPAGQYGSGYVYLKQAELWGATMTGDLTVGQNAAVHYDRNLGSIPLPRSPTVSRLEYLYVSVHGIDVSERRSVGLPAGTILPAEAGRTGWPP